jgi:hypothetical protein
VVLVEPVLPVVLVPPVDLVVPASPAVPVVELSPVPRGLDPQPIATAAPQASAAPNPAQRRVIMPRSLDPTVDAFTGRGPCQRGAPTRQETRAT